MIVKVNTGWELYVYMNGQLLYKRWLKHGYGMVMQENSWGNFKASDSYKSIIG